LKGEAFISHSCKKQRKELDNPWVFFYFIWYKRKGGVYLPLEDPEGGGGEEPTPFTRLAKKKILHLGEKKGGGGEPSYTLLQRKEGKSTNPKSREKKKSLIFLKGSEKEKGLSSREGEEKPLGPKVGKKDSFVEGKKDCPQNTREKGTAQKNPPQGGKKRKSRPDRPPKRGEETCFSGGGGGKKKKGDELRRVGKEEKTASEREEKALNSKIKKGGRPPLPEKGGKRGKREQREKKALQGKRKKRPLRERKNRVFEGGRLLTVVGK